MSSEDPWEGLAPPDVAEVINARRVNAAIPWDFFWARGQDGRYLLVLRHSMESTPAGRLPRLRGIEIREHVVAEHEPATLIFKLLDSAQKDIFHRLCQDIVERAAAVANEREAVHVALARTWRWHHLLSGGSDGRLSIEEQQGLIGELQVLELLLLPRLNPTDAVAAWRGPLGSPKDFEVGLVGIEAKARRGTATPYVRVSSEHQLDGAGTDALFLYVAELARSPSGRGEGESVSDVARRVRRQIEVTDPAAVEPFDAMVEAAGLRWEDDYSDTRWLFGEGRLYRVGDGFPRLTASAIPAGVSTVSYAIALADCEQFRTSPADLGRAIGIKE
jgi:hypothetical protein